MSKRLLIISGFINEDRPTGGVTMHVHRMLKRLIEPNVLDFELCDYKKENLIIQLRKIKKADVMHMHASNAYLKLLYVMSGKVFNTKSLITVHGKYGVYSPLKNIIHRLALKWCDIPILINKESYEAVKKFNPRAIFIPAFMPPIEAEEQLSQDMEIIIKGIKADGKSLFVTNASSRAFTDNNQEIYGIDFLVEFFRKHSEWNLVVLDPNNDYSSIYNNNLSGNVRIYNGLHSFCGLIKMADVVIRNTPTDGDSFSVKEALCLKKPIIATDAVSRPEGVFLFKYNDEDSLSKAIKTALSYKGAISLKEQDATNAYYQLYKELEII